MEQCAGWISATEWARRVGVSVQRARALARDGTLPARRIGRMWAIDADSTEGHSRGHGRPLSSRSAWAIIDVLDGRRPEGLSRSEVLRARQRAAALDGLQRGDLSRRAVVRRFRAHPGVLARLEQDPRVVIGGARAAIEHGADLISLDDHELYVHPLDLDGLVGSYGLRETRVDSNVQLHISDRRPATERGVASLATAALDLLDSGDERSARAARAMLRRARKGEPRR